VTSLETTLLRTAIGKGTTIFCPRRLKHIVVIFAKQRQRSKENLTVQRKSTSTK